MVKHLLYDKNFCHVRYTFYNVKGEYNKIWVVCNTCKKRKA
jgi:hypothetical protein